MIELEKRLVTAPTPEMTLGSRKAFRILIIWRGVYVVPAQQGTRIFYINNYIDFELYN